MKTWNFARRNAREILRDPISLGFGLGFPVVLLLLMSAIQANVPVKLFVINNLAPGIAIFGLSFLTLFSATLIARDRGTSLLERLYTTPMRPCHFILGYTLPLLPMGLAQSAICYGLSLVLGLKASIHLFWAMLLMIPAVILFTALGLMCGSVLSDKQVGGLCGALLTNLTAWLSGAWFDLSMVGGAFKAAAELLPFSHAVELQRAIIAGSYAAVGPHMLWVAGYAVVAVACAIWLFLRQMRRK